MTSGRSQATVVQRPLRLRRCRPQQGDPQPRPGSPRRAAPPRRRARAPDPDDDASPRPRAARRSPRRRARLPGDLRLPVARVVDGARKWIGRPCQKQPSRKTATTVAAEDDVGAARDRRDGPGVDAEPAGPAGGAPTAGRVPAPCTRAAVAEHVPSDGIARGPGLGSRAAPNPNGRPALRQSARGRRRRASAPRGRRGEGDPGGPQRAGSDARERGPDRVDARIGAGIVGRADVVTPGGRSACSDHPASSV